MTDAQRDELQGETTHLDDSGRIEWESQSIKSESINSEGRLLLA
jgi:hypothetical protein